MLTIDFLDYYKLIKENADLKQVNKLRSETIAAHMADRAGLKARLAHAERVMKNQQERLHRMGGCNLNIYKEAKELKDENTKLRHALEKIAQHDAQHVAITALRGAGQ